MSSLKNRNGKRGPNQDGILFASFGEDVKHSPYAQTRWGADFDLVFGEEEPKKLVPPRSSSYTAKAAFENHMGYDCTLESSLIRCIETLTDDINAIDAIKNLLALIGEFYDADRTHLYEFTPSKKVVTNSYEWTSPTGLPIGNSSYLINTEELTFFSKQFRKNGHYIVENIYKDLDPMSSMFKMLVERRVHSLILVPIFSKDKVTSFVGVDNPRRERKNLALLHAISLFIRDNLKKLVLFKELESLNYTDSVTGLFNRNKYNEKLDQLEQDELKTLGIIRLDVNGLKNINALYGDEYGNYVLLQTGKLLNKYVHYDVFRIGNGEFIALCPDISKHDFDAAISFIREEEARIEEYSIAIGGAWEWHDIDVMRVITNAGEIMHAEKQKYYKSVPNDYVQIRLNPADIVLSEIREGLFHIYLQPKVELQNGKIIGAEALVRKHLKNGKSITPERFVPVYEHDGTIRHVDFFVLEETCKLLQKMLRANAAVPIAVNFSRSTFIAYDLVKEIIKICAEYEIPHEFIKIEITESIDKMDFSFFEKKLQSIHEAGFSVSLDDFGAKYSNLAMLSIPYFSEVKIDKILLDNMDISEKNCIIVKYIIDMIHEFKTSKCLVEGIETESQRQALLALGCEYGQGYYFYRPMPADEFMELLVNNDKN